MDSLGWVLLQFLTTAAIVVVAGTWLARFGDAIGARTGIGGIWIGTVLIAAATSLPELATDVAAVRIGAIDIALGDLFGSSMANMLILALLDLGYPHLRLLREAAHDNLLSAALAIVLTCLALLSLILQLPATLFGFGAGSLAIAVAYLAGSRAIYLRSTSISTAAVDPHKPAISLRRGIAGFGISALVILLAAPTFARSAESLATLSGLGNSFIGTWLVGVATSLPELAATLAAVRLRAFDMAVGNLYGSNCFNMLLLLPLDIANGGRPVLNAADPSHAITALVAVILMATGIAALIFRAERRFALSEPNSALMALTYIVALILLYVRQAGG